MDLITIVVEDLGVDAITYDSKGNPLLNLAKVRCAKKGYQDKWELSVCVSKKKEQTPNGYTKLSVFETQSKEDREARLPRNYVGNGIRLFEEKEGDGLPY